MNFEEWMKAQGLPESSIKKYADAISGPLTLWADLQNFSSGSLNTVVDLEVFNALAKKIEATDDYQIRNKRGLDMYGAALNKYREFLSAQHT
jgi:putative restriction endonuclease